MVKVTNRTVTRGVAGKRTGSVKGVVMHNTWDNQTAEWNMNRLKAMSDLQLQSGFAHYYIDENEIIRTEDTYNMAWHTANKDGNANYIGFEIRGNRSTSRAILLQAEQNACWQAAIDLRFYKLPVNRNTVRLHHEFSATECPKASLIEHCGYDSTYAVPQHVTNQIKDYFIKEIKKYYDNPKLTPDGKANSGKPVETVKPKPQPAKPIPKPTGKTYKGFTPEKGTFTVTVSEGIQVRVNGYGLTAPKGGLLKNKQSITYDGWAVKDGYTWVHYIGNTGDDLFLPVRPTGKAAWGTFK